MNAAARTGLGRRDAVAALVICGFAGLLFRDVVFRGLIFFERDVYLHWFGQAETIVRCVAKGAWPLWDPYLGFGQPLLANPSAQILYPWTWLNLLASPGPVYSIYVVSHFVLSAFGLYLFLRQRDLSRTAALAGAATWMAGGPLLSLVSLWHHLAGAAWIPWVLLTFEAAALLPSAGRAVRAGGVLALQILAGSADMCAMTGVMALIVIGPRFDWAKPSSRENRHRLAATLVAILLGLGLSAAQWLPSLAVARESARWNLDQAVRTYWSVHPALLAQTVLPVFVEELPLTKETRTALFEGREPFLTSLYLGLAATPLLVAGVFSRSREAAPFLVAGLGSVLVALGRHTFVYDLALLALPPLRILRFPSKAMVVAALCWACLVALGCDSWRTRPERALRVSLWAGLVALGMGLVVLLPLRSGDLSFLALPAGGPSYSLVVGPIVALLGKTLLVVAALVVVSLVALRRPSAHRPLTGLAACLAVLDLWMVSSGINPVAPKSLFAAPPPTLAPLAGHEPARVFGFEYLPGTRSALLLKDAFVPRPGLSLPVAYSQALGYQLYLLPSIARRYGVFGSYGVDTLGLQPGELRGLSDLARAAEGTPVFERLLRLGAVGFVLALHQEGLEGLVLEATVASPFREPIRVFSVPGSLPRSYVVGGLRVAAGEEAYRALLDVSFDPTREIVLDSGTTTLPPSGPVGSSRLVDHRPDRVRLDANLSLPGYLVLVEAYDPGWRAFVDGQEVPVLRANTAFRAVALPAGNHEVEFRYRPRGVTLGLSVSLIALGAATALVGGHRYRRTRAPR